MSERDQGGSVIVVTNSGDYGATVIDLFNGHKIIETRDGSDNVVQQFIHGTQYIDELVMMRVRDKGELSQLVLQGVPGVAVRVHLVVEVNRPARPAGLLAFRTHSGSVPGTLEPVLVRQHHLP